MVLVKNRVKYFYYILSIKAAKCNPFCTRFIRGSYNYYTKKIKEFLSFYPFFMDATYRPAEDALSDKNRASLPGNCFHSLYPAVLE